MIEISLHCFRISGDRMENPLSLQADCCRSAAQDNVTACFAVSALNARALLFAVNCFQHLKDEHQIIQT